MQKSRSEGAAWWVVAAVSIAGLAARAIAIGRAFVGPDAWRQADTAAIARNFLTDPRLLWPRVDWGAPGPGYVEAELPLYPWLVHWIYRLGGVQEIFGQLLSAIAIALAGIAVWRIARRYLSPNAALLALVFFAFAPLTFRYGRTFMPDALALMFAVWAIELFHVGVAKPSWRWMVTAACTMALAILTKPTAIHLGIPLIALAVVTHRGQWWQVRVAAPLLVFAAVALAPVAVYFAHAADLHNTYGNTFGVLSGGDAKWATVEVLTDPNFFANLARFMGGWVAGPVVALLAIWGLWRRPKPRWRAFTWSWLGAYLVYVLVVGRYSGYLRGLHYHLYAVPLFCIAAAAGLQALGTRARWALAAVALAAQLLIDAHVLRQIGHEAPVVAGRALGQISPRGALVGVVAFDTERDRGAPNNFQQPTTLYAADRRGRVLAADHQDLAHLKVLRGAGVGWLVTFPELDHWATPEFRQALAADWTVIEQGKGYVIRRANGMD